MNLLKCISHRSYEERLKHLGLPTLEYRRARTDMVQVYKIINQSDKVDISRLFTFASHGAIRGHSLKLLKPRARLNETVRTTRPEKCDIFAQRYQSQPITKIPKTRTYFLNLQKPCQNIPLSEYYA